MLGVPEGRPGTPDRRPDRLHSMPVNVTCPGRCRVRHPGRWSTGLSLRSPTDQDLSRLTSHVSGNILV